MGVTAFGAHGQFVFLNVLITAKPAFVVHRTTGPNHPSEEKKKGKKIEKYSTKKQTTLPF